MSDQDLKKENEDLKNKVKELRKKLEDRNPAFSGNLLKQADSTFRDLQEKIGKAIYSAVGQDFTYLFP